MAVFIGKVYWNQEDKQKSYNHWLDLIKMNEKPKRPILQFNISAWYILILCLIATALTSHFISMYATVHWPILTSSYNLKSHMELIEKDDAANRLIQENKNLKLFFDTLPNVSEKIHTAGWKLLGKTSLYHILGLVSFILSIFTFCCRPWWVGIISLPFGLYSIFLATTMM